MIIVRIVQFVKIVQLVQLDYYGYIKFFGVFVGTWVGAFTFYVTENFDRISYYIKTRPTILCGTDIVHFIPL